MRLLRKGHVYCHQHYVGAISEHSVPAGTEFTFQYDIDYVKSGRAPISAGLPIKLDAYRWNNVPPFFNNLLSEGTVKRSQAKLAHLDQDDDFGMLLEYGSQLIGPIRVLKALNTSPESGATGQFTRPKKVTPGFQINFSRETFNEIAVPSLKGTSIPGAHQKMFLSIEGARSKTLTRSGGAGQFIVKPSPYELPELAENEFITMQICRAVGLNVADHYLVPFSCGELAYVTRRFDIDTHKKPDFVEDLASCMNVSPGNKSHPAISYEKAIKAAYRLCGGHAQILRDGFLHVLMAFIVGNNDLHLKNLSLMRGRNERIYHGFTPVYDMVSTAPYPHYDKACELSLSLLDIEADDDALPTSNRSNKHYTQSDFLAFAEAIGLGRKVAIPLIQRLLTKIERMSTKIVSCSPGSGFLKTTILERIEERMARLRVPDRT